MSKWHRTRRGDIGLRAIGAGACALSCLSIRQLLRLHDADPSYWSSGAFAYLMAATAFLCGSMGSAFLVLGSHLLDEIAIAVRWRAKSAAEKAAGAVAAGGWPAAPRSFADERGARTVAAYDAIGLSREDASPFPGRSTEPVAMLRRMAMDRRLQPSISATMIG